MLIMQAWLSIPEDCTVRDTTYNNKTRPPTTDNQRLTLLVCSHISVSLVT